ncbi:MAG: hypothetical protein LBV54_07195 [Puniceicoccales bacterium]|jgi:hypothetical protein|nr:hypothetical protein [Puniceicoccales bacterium]
MGLVLGGAIGIAFIGGWTLAQNSAGKESLYDFNSRPAAVSVPGTSGDAPPVLPAADPAQPVSDAVPTLPADAPEAVPVSPPVPELPPAHSPPVPATPEVPSAVPTAVEPSKPDVIEAAHLAILTEPGAQVLLEEEGHAPRFLGVADHAGNLNVAEAMHAGSKTVSLVFKHPECIEARRESVVLEAGAKVAIEERMRPKPGTLVVSAEPSSAEIILDGKSKGRGFVRVDNVSSRVPHVLEVRTPDADMVQRTIIISPNIVTVERINLVRTEPSASVRQEPRAPAQPEVRAPGPVVAPGGVLLQGAMLELTRMAGVRVRIDERPIGIEQGHIRNVKAGDHVLTLLRDSVANPAVPQILWRRAVHVVPGETTILSNTDTMSGLEDTAPLTMDATKAARLTLALTEGKAKAIPVNLVSVTFNSVPLVLTKSGAWLVPVSVAGILRVTAPGFLIEERSLHFNTPGDYSLSCVLRSTTGAATTPGVAKPALPPAAGKSWVARVIAVSPDNGLIVIGDVAGRPVKAGNNLVLSPVAVAEPRIRMSVIEVKNGVVLCQMLPDKTHPILPERGADALVTPVQ